MTSHGKFAYIVSNLVDGIGGYACRMRTTHWHSNTLEHGVGSPGRKYLNSFLCHELPNMTAIGNIDVLDIGCGSGYFQRLLADMGYRGSYIGMDICRHTDFDKSRTDVFKADYVQSKIEDFETVGKFDLILSNTALEHIENDALAIAKCNEMLKPGGVQIHIVPTFWSLFLYLVHGFRQYSPKRVKAMFLGTNYKVYRLGGLFSFLLHVSFITIPVFGFKTDRLRDLGIYPKLVEMCNVLDRLAPVCSCLYVVVARNVGNI
jgi:SAM-dependent methyltransferase